MSPSQNANTPNSNRQPFVTPLASHRAAMGSGLCSWRRALAPRLAYLIAPAGRRKRGASVRCHLIGKRCFAALLIAFGGAPRAVSPARSQLGDVVLRRHRLARRDERSHPCLELLIGERGARPLVQSTLLVPLLIRS